MCGKSHVKFMNTGSLYVFCLKSLLLKLANHHQAQADNPNSVYYKLSRVIIIKRLLGVCLLVLLFGAQAPLSTLVLMLFAFTFSHIYTRLLASWLVKDSGFWSKKVA